MIPHSHARFAVVAALAIAGVAVAQDRGESVRAELSAAERRAADAAAPLREREQSADRAIELRRQLIAQVPEGEASLPDLLAAQGAALMDRLSRDGADSALLFGLPTPTQRQLARQSAGEAEGLLARAATLADALLARLGGAGSDQPGASAAEQLATVRIPFFRARAEVLLARSGEGASRAQAAGDRIARMTLVSPSAEGARRATLAAALLLRSPPDVSAAAEEAGWVLASPEATGVPASVKVEAWQALIHIGAAQDRLDAVLEQSEKALSQKPFLDAQARVDALAAVLITDAATSALWERGAREARPEMLARACALQHALLARTDLTVRGDSLAPLVFEKLAALELPQGSTLRSPPMVALARAVIAARDPARRELALSEFQRLADDPDAGAYAADALWERCVMLLQPPKGKSQADDASRLEGVGTLMSLAERFPDHPRALEALSAALLHARALASSDVGATREGGSRAYRRALLLATESFPALPDINAWRFERARLAEAGLGSIDDDELRAAIAIVREIPAQPPKPLSGDDVRTLGERLQLALIDRWRTQARDLRTQGRDAELRTLAVERLAVEARRAADWAREHASKLADRFRFDAAEALLDAGDSGAAPLYAELLDHKAIVPGGVPGLELGLARSKLLAGKDAEAFALLKSAAEHTDAPTDSAHPASRPEAFWHAWTLMLETLQKQNGAGDRSGPIRAHLRRLTSIDPAMGGEPWASRLRRVGDAVK